MGIQDLDEAQGLTLGMVEAHLHRKDWHRFVSATGPRWQIPGGAESYATADIRFLVARIAEYERVTEQALLRGINPRMRKGCPSDAAIDAHNGYWLMRFPYNPPTVVRWYQTSGGEWRTQQSNGRNFTVTAAEASECLFWPCDAEANKVRWPEKKGVML